jgi:hypothetical protein
MYWNTFMQKFKRDRVELLKELRNMTTKELEHSEDRRQSRRYRLIRKEVDKWISELKEE